MVESNLFAIPPLSPPTSPRQSASQSEQSSNSWQEQHQTQQASTAESEIPKMALAHQEASAPSLTLDTKPMLHSHKSFPYTLNGGSHNHPDTPPLNEHDRPSTAAPGDLSTPTIGEMSTNEIPSATFGGSAPASPLSDAAPDSALIDGEGDSSELGLGIDMTGENGEKKPMTAAEIRAQKRKMKRFRLTHNQTRFLMSEFARQAHPDAAHRERLAREIPGLTPRQVQVWFQNRRAKLKRLTSDDRERMMRSRALPDDFDMTNALHSPYGAIQNVSSALSSPAGYSSIAENNMIRPLSLDSLRRIPDGPHMSPIPGYGGFNFTPPQSVTDGLSPVSPAGDSPFTYSPTLDGQRRNPFGGGINSPSFTSHPQIPRLQMHERDPRNRPEGLASPLRPALSYPPHHGEMHSPNSPLTNESNSSHGMMPYGLSYSYPNSMSGFAATANSRMRPFNGSAPRSIDINPATSGPPSAPQSAHPDSPHSGHYPSYTSSSVPNTSPFPMLSPQHHGGFPSPYPREESQDNHENNNSESLTSY